MLERDEFRRLENLKNESRCVSKVLLLSGVGTVVFGRINQVKILSVFALLNHVELVSIYNPIYISNGFHLLKNISLSAKIISPETLSIKSKRLESRDCRNLSKIL